MAGPWDQYADADAGAPPWEQYADTGERALPKGVKPSAVEGGRGSAADPRRLDIPPVQQTRAPAATKNVAPEAPSFSDPMGASDFSAISQQPTARESVLDGVDMPEPTFDPQEGARLSNRTYAERSQQPARAAPSMSRISGKTIPVNEQGTLSRAGTLVKSQLDSYASGLGYKLGDAADAVGATRIGQDLKDRGAALQERSGNASQSVSLSADGAFEKYAPQILAVFPTMAVAAATGGLPVMFGVSEVQQYAEGRKAGLSPLESLGRAVPMGAAEVIGEKLGGTGKLLEALEKAAVKGGSLESLKELSGRLAASGLREVPSEEATYAMQFGIDKTPNIGLQQNAGAKEFLEGAKDTAIVAAGAGGAMAGSGMAVQRLARIKQLRDAGETGVADLLQTKHDKQTAVEAVDGELAAMPGNEQFQGHYRNMRTAGVKPAEAAARAATTTVFGQVGEQAGMTPKAIDAALQKASTLPVDQVPAFLDKYTKALAARGLAQPFDGIDQLGTSLEAARDEAIDAAVGAAYTQGEARKAMDDVLALEQKNQPKEQSNPAPDAIETVAPIIQPEDSNVSRTDDVPGPDSGSDQRGGADTGIGLPAQSGVPGGRAVQQPGDADSGPAAGPVLLATPDTGELNAGVLDDTNPQAGAAAQAEAAAGEAAEARADQPASGAAAGEPAGTGDVQADGVGRGPGGISEPLTGSVKIKNGDMIEMRREFSGKYQIFKAGKKVGIVQYTNLMTGGFRISGVNINSENRRQGIATAAYDFLESVTGQPFEAAGGQSVDGRAFREARKATQSVDSVDTSPGPVQKTPESIQVGRNNVPLTEGGKPFKNKLAADNARKGQTTMRTVRVEGGFALTEKTEAQMRAGEAAAKRLRTPNTSPAGEAIPAHAMIASEGGLSPFERADMGMEGNVTIGNRKLFAGTGKGLSIERATARLIEDGYLPEGASHDQARSLIKRSLTSPQYTPEGTERMAEKEAQERFEAELRDQEAIAKVEGNTDNQFKVVESLQDDVPDFDAPSSMSEADAMRAMGFTEQEIESATANRSDQPQGNRRDDGGADAPAQDEARAGDGQRMRATSGDPGSGSNRQGPNNEVNQTPPPSGVSNSEAFVRAPDGTQDFGEITSDMAATMKRQAGKIRLQEGNESFGLAHIEARHGGQIRKAGYQSIPQFVSDALSQIDTIWKPAVTSQLVVLQTTGKGRAVFIQLTPGKDKLGDFYTVNTAFPTGKGFGETKEGWRALWSKIPGPAEDSGKPSSFAVPASKTGRQDTMDSNQSEAASVAEITFALRDSGSLAVKGNPQAIRDKLVGITKITSMEGGMMVGKTQAAKAIAILDGKPAEAKAARPLSVGIMASNAEPVTVKDGTVYIGKNEAINFDSGEPVTVKAGASDADIVRALKDAGALSRRQKVFGLQENAENQPVAQEKSVEPADDAIKSASAPDAKPERPEALIELRKRESVLKALSNCLG